MPEIIGLGLFILIYSLSVFFLYRGLFILSKYTLMLSTMGSIIMGYVFLLGKTPGIHIYFLLFAILPIVIFSFREKLIIVVLFLLNLICFLIVEIFLPEDYPLLRFPGKYEVSFHILSNVITFTLIAIIILLYQWLTEENEKELHKQSEQLRELNATKDKFFSIIAHDLRNPFNAILNSSKLLIMKFSTYSEDRKFRMISAIHESSTNLSNLLENLLLWSQLQSKKIRVYNEEHDLAELVEENIDLYRKSLKNKEIELEKYLQPNIKISTDRYIVSLVMRNLISNAIKFTKSGGRITISLRMNDPEFVEISVKDSGIGIKEEDKRVLFEYFSQQENRAQIGKTVADSDCHSAKIRLKSSAGILKC